VSRTSRVRILHDVDEGQSQQAQTAEALGPAGEECEACGTEMFGLRCKLVCPKCGYRRDCSDP